MRNAPETKKLPLPSIDCAVAFTDWYGFPVCPDMDIQTQVAWENWQIAWNASDAARKHSLEGASIASVVRGLAERSRIGNAMFPQVMGEVEKDEAAAERIAKLAEYYGKVWS